MILVLHFLKAYIKLNEIVIVTIRSYCPDIKRTWMNVCDFASLDIMRTLCVGPHACAGDAHQSLLHSGCYHSNNQPWGPNTWRPDSEVRNVQNQCLIVRLFATLTHSFLYNAQEQWNHLFQSDWLSAASRSRGMLTCKPNIGWRYENEHFWRRTDLSDNIHQVSGVTSLKECSFVWEAKKAVIHELTVYYVLVLSRDGEMICE